MTKGHRPKKGGNHCPRIPVFGGRLLKLLFVVIFNALNFSCEVVYLFLS